MRSSSSALASKRPFSPSAAPSGDLTTFPLPVEVIQRVLVFCRPWDVIAFSRTCHLAYTIVFDFSDQHLWRELFLSYPFDDPRQALDIAQAGDSPSIDWRQKTIGRLTAEWVAKSPPTPNCQTSRALQAFISMVQDVSPMIQGRMAVGSHNLEWLERVLRQSDILDIEIEAPRSEGMPYAQLRAYLALSLDERADERTRLRLEARRKRSRIYVYNVRNYGGRNWGPFLPDDTVDWIHMEHIINVIVMNLRELPGMWSTIKPPLGLAAIRPYSAPSTGLESSLDWAGVEGTWRRYVSFMDFRDLYAFNFDFNRQLGLDPTFFDCPQFREGTRLLELKLHVIAKDQSRFRDHRRSNTSTRGIDGKYPPIYFAGTSKGVKQSTVMEGMVHMSPDGVVRWEFDSTHPGGARWCSDGAQIGHIASATGVAGIWTTNNRCRDDAVGPFWLWKVREDCPVQLMEFSR
ncbi:hypothetical protein FPV67DRAFT_1524606 [Lyophyllum atratum]|nr:hypothetical protein FPV67DRAFT_1524606 [Lyophyllum atratum]